MPNINIQWDEPLTSLISEQALHESLDQAVKQHILTDPEFQKAVGQIINSTGVKLTTQAIASEIVASFQKQIVEQLQGKLSTVRQELGKCLADYKAMHTMHASDYAKRRHDELLKKITDLDSQ